jgi:hypothetical protein
MTRLISPSASASQQSSPFLAGQVGGAAEAVVHTRRVIKNRMVKPAVFADRRDLLMSAISLSS